MSKNIQIALVDDHTVMRSALAGFLKGVKGFSVLFEAADKDEFFGKLTWEEKPDVILMDYGLGNDDGSTCIKYLRKNYGYDIGVLALSMHQEVRIVREMIDAGANGYLFKGLDTDEIIKAIKDVFENGFHINKYTKNLVFGNRSATVIQDEYGLTDLENEIIKCICAQMNNEQIASKLDFTLSTISTYRKKILKKTGCINTAGLVVFAVKNKIFILD
ncbi:MAG: DNA-binding NarL/FixJ family response regulator [Bacteroidia bacterium]